MEEGRYLDSGLQQLVALFQREIDHILVLLIIQRITFALPQSGLALNCTRIAIFLPQNQ